MNALLVLTVDLFDTRASAAVTLTADGVVEQLPITGGPEATTLSLPEIITDALTQCAAAAAHRVGVLMPPEQLVITHPPHWNQQQCAAVHAAVDAAGFAPNRVLVRARPVPVAG